jgi:hypothetical protein
MLAMTGISLFAKPSEYGLQKDVVYRISNFF